MKCFNFASLIKPAGQFWNNHKQYLPYLVLFFVFLLAAANAYAAVPFLGTLQSKIEEVTAELSSGLGRTIVTLVIVIFGIGTLMGRINKVFGLSIIAGALIITFSSDISTWVIGN
jgi:type IV secretory pathway VirB2 component (pilin)